MHSKVTINRPWTTPTTLCMTRTMEHKDQPLLGCVSGVKGYLVMMNFELITPPKKLKNSLCYDLNITKNFYTYFEKTHCLVLCFGGSYYYFFFWGGGVVIFIICLYILTICLVLDEYTSYLYINLIVLYRTPTKHPLQNARKLFLWQKILIYLWAFCFRNSLKHS